MTRLRTRFLAGATQALACALLAGACSTAPSVTPPDLADPPPDLAGYPEGPYGAELDTAVRNFTWKGYLNTEGTAISTTKTFGDVSLEDVRKSGGRYLLIATGALW